MTKPTLVLGNKLPPGVFVTVRRVPVFVEHEATLSDGRRVRFDWRLLSAIVRNCNRRIEEAGGYATVIIGHTKGPGDNPPIIGFAGPFSLGILNGRVTVFADFHLYPEHADALRRYPRRSAEFILHEDLSRTFFDPIALLGGEVPRLDLGVTLLYSAIVNGARVERYAAVMPGPSNTYLPRHGVTEEYAHMNDEQLKAIIEALEQLDWVQWVKRKMAEETEANENNVRPSDAEREQTETYTELPSEKVDPQKAKEILEHGEAHGQPLTEAQKRMFGAAAAREKERSDTPRESYRAIVAQIERLQQELEAERAERINAQRQATLVALRQQYAFDLTREMERCAWPKMSDAQFEEHVQCIRENYRRIPIGERWPILPSPPMDVQPEQYSEDQRRRARELVLRERERGVELTFEEALSRVTGRA
jgi:hypothetical protein